MNKLNKEEECYYGEHQCSKEKCKNNAYYEVDGKLFCGTHSKAKEKIRIILLKNKNKEQNKELELKEEKRLIKCTQENNQIALKKGNVIVTKLHMMGMPALHSGYLKIFPNYRHQNRKDGFGCASLSPKSIGPIAHNMPGIPIAQSLENYWQGAKIYNFELEKNDNNDLKNIITDAIVLLKGLYKDKTPIRRKYTAAELKKKAKYTYVEFSLFKLSTLNISRYSAGIFLMILQSIIPHRLLFIIGVYFIN